MIIKFKVIPDSKTNEWIGWFGDNVIKLRLTIPRVDMEAGLRAFIEQDLGIKQSDMQTIPDKDKALVVIKFPDIAWELFLSTIEK